jgi:hypothetical protein
MKVLHLTLKRKWFDMIASGEKKEEYREITPYWIKRLRTKMGDFMYFDHVLFANGGHFGDVPKMNIELLRITIGKGKKKWGAEPGKKYFVIKLGRISLPPLP